MPTNGQAVKIAHYSRSKFNSLTNKDSGTIYYVEESNGEIKQYIGSVQVISKPSYSYSEITGSKPPVNATANTGTVTNVSSGTQIFGMSMTVASGTTTPTITTAITDASDFRAAIGAGTSDLLIGTTSSTAKAGNYQPTWSQVTGKPTFAPSNAQKNSDITKAEIEAKLTGSITTHTHSQYLTSFTETDPTVPSHVKGITTGNISSWNGKATTSYVDGKTDLKSNTDNRAVNTIPNDYNAKLDIKGLKSNTTLGITGQGSYSTLLGIRGWTDSSGGNSHEFALTGDGEIYHRHGATTTWNAWNVLAKQSWVTANTRSSSWTPTWSQVSSKPTFATVATSGSYNDLSNKPSIPSAYELTKAKIDTALEVGSSTSTIQLGTGTSVSGNFSTALGNSASVSGSYSTALGYQSKSLGPYSTALGNNASASGEESIALGSSASASGNFSTAIGSGYSSAGANWSTALGNSSTASGRGSTALGFGASAGVDWSTALGYNSSASGEASIALGNSSKASGYYSTAVGRGATASNDYSTALGQGASATGSSSTALGRGAITGTTSNRIQLGNEAVSSLRSSVSLTVTSDIRDKTDIEEVSKALDFIKDLNPITYVGNDRSNYITEEQKETETYKDYLMVEDYDKVSHSQGSKKGSRRRVGLSAQEVRDKLIEHYGSDNYANVVDDNFVEFEERGLDIPEGLENKLTMSYETMVPFLIKAIQEQQEQIEELKMIVKERS